MPAMLPAMLAVMLLRRTKDSHPVHKNSRIAVAQTRVLIARQTPIPMSGPSPQQRAARSSKPSPRRRQP
jgi:hypothetical protein